MQNNTDNPRDAQNKNKRPSYDPADQNAGREGGDDSLADASPTDPRDDEKVIVNEQREHKTVNTPSQTAANTSEGISTDEDTIDNS